MPKAMKITVEAFVPADVETVWDAWNDPEHIKQWNAASEDWHTPRSTVDLRVGGKQVSRMEARDGSMGFDFEATYTAIEPHKRVASRLGDGREILVEFEEVPGGVRVRETFDAETENDPEFQRQGWQAILDNFARHVQQSTR